MQRAQEQGCQGTSISFNEPTLSLEWSLDVFRLAGAHGLYHTYVTNGYMTRQPLRALVEAELDAMNIDLKSDAAAVRRYCGTDFERVWRSGRKLLDCRLACIPSTWGTSPITFVRIHSAQNVVKYWSEGLASGC